MLLCKNNPLNLAMKTLVLMEDVGHTFQLSGSRFFGTDTPKSDWDFFTQDTQGVRLWLRINGFALYPNTSSYAGDGFCVDVFVFNGGGMDDDLSQQIHVQVVKDFVLKQNIQDKLASMYSYHENGKLVYFPTDKRLAKSIWTQAFEFYSMGRNDGYQVGVNVGHDLATLVMS